MTNKFARMYAGYLCGCCKQNIIESYFPLVANAIKDKGFSELYTPDVISIFNDVYGIKLPMTLMHSVLSVGVKNKVFEYNPKRSVYHVNPAEIKKWDLDLVRFDGQFEDLRREYCKYLSAHGEDWNTSDVEEEIVNNILEVDMGALEDFAGHDDSGETKGYYRWARFVVETRELRSDLYDFIAALYCSVIAKDLTFSEEDTRYRFAELWVYLDAPIVLSLLGLDDDVRVEMCQQLVQEMAEAKCHLYVFPHTLEEVERIVRDAVRWVRSGNFDYLKASPAGVKLYEMHLSDAESDDFVENAIARVFEQFKIYIDNNSYYDEGNWKWHESEDCITKLIVEKYESKGKVFDEQMRGIRTDAKSIGLIYVARKGYCPRHIYDARRIMLTFNRALTFVAARYEKTEMGHVDSIPACVSMDLMGTTLWLHRPVDLFEYKKRQLLADLYVALRPTRALCEQVIERIREAQKHGTISEMEIVKLRTSRYTRDALAQTFQGDPASFSDQNLSDLSAEIDARHQKELEESLKKQKSEFDALLAEERARHSADVKNINDRRIAAEQEVHEVNDKINDLGQKLSRTTDKLARIQERRYSRVKKIADAFGALVGTAVCILPGAGGGAWISYEIGIGIGMGSLAAFLGGVISVVALRCCDLIYGRIKQKISEMIINRFAYEE